MRPASTEAHMKRVFKGLLSAAVIAVATTPVVAQGAVDNTAYGSTSAEFLLLGAGARGAALGGSFAALANDVSALYWNPAGIAMMERPSLSASVMNYVADTRYAWVGLAFPMSGGQRSIGIHGATFGFGDQPVYTVADPTGESGETYSVAETYVGVSYAQNFSDRFSAGVTGKVISDQLGRTSGTGYAFDFGTNFHALVGSRPLRASFVIQNLGSTIRHTGSGLDVSVRRAPPTGQNDLPQEQQPARLRSKDFGLPVTFRVGLAFDVMSSSASSVTLLSEFTQPNNTNAAANGGLEWSLLNLGGTGFSVAARGSYTYQGDNNISPDAAAAGFATSFSSDENLDGLALGGGLNYGSRSGFGFGIDYAWKNLGLLGGVNFFSATISW